MQGLLLNGIVCTHLHFFLNIWRIRSQLKVKMHWSFVSIICISCCICTVILWIHFCSIYPSIHPSRFPHRRPGKPWGEWRAEEVHGCVPAAGVWPAAPPAGHHCGAIQRAGLRSHVLHWLCTLQPFHEGPGQDEKHESVRALSEPECGAPGKCQGARWHCTCDSYREGSLWSFGDTVQRAPWKGLVTVQAWQVFMENEQWQWCFYFIFFQF